ncbi:MAG: AAA family ATPase [Deltaproteobacteria bacterium]|jgi:aminoglycoside phosphotransferase family enzyme/predicted kinase
MATQQDKHQSQIIEYMRRPDFYPHPVRSVTLRETHISMVFLTGDYVYKIKKPVDMGFLDFTSLVKRQHYCRRELKLNRRLSRNVYLAVVPITFRQNRYYLDGSGRPVEYAVKMRQLPHSATMVNLLRDDKLDGNSVELLARVLSQFYNQAGTGDRIDACGNHATIEKNCEENFIQLKEFEGNTISPQMLLFIRSATRSFLNRRKAFFKKRVESGRIRDCHGDLRSGHIYFVEDGIQIIDCIEFNERFRYNDVASDLAFLAMDLDFEGFSAVARVLLKAYVHYSNDEDVYIMMNFYKCYRALVRVKVNCLRLQQNDLAEEKRFRLLEKTQRFMDLAYGYAEQFARPTVWVVCGMTATGKSTIARQLAGKFNIKVLSSDLIRKGLFRNQAQERFAFEKGMYSREATSMTYGKLYRLAQEEIENENSVILDATFSRKNQRREVLRLAEDMDANIVFIECLCSEAVIKDRLAKRNATPTLSDARLEHFENLKGVFEPLDDISQGIHLTVDTQKPPDDNIRDILTRRDLPIPG